MVGGKACSSSDCTFKTRPSTFGQGPAGDIVLVAIDEVVLDNGQVFVISGSDSPTGDLAIRGQNVRIENGSTLSAESATVDGGNIVLDLDQLLLLRDASLITATAGTAQSGGDGGNVNITAPFVVAIPTENSDIVANAFEGDGVRVRITAR